MNTIDLLDKLNLPSQLGLDGDNALFSKKTIMDAYLSAASLQFNKQFMSGDNLYSTNNGFYDNSMNMDLPKTSSVDLFKMLGADNVSTVNDDDSTDTKIVLDLMKMSDLNQHTDPIMTADLVISPKVQSDSHDLIDTESESYTKLEADHKKVSAKKGKGKKGDKSDINVTINEERRRLLKKLDSCEDDRTVFKRRVKNSKKNQVNAENYRGSRFWGVSKNKSKWQVMITLNHYKEYKGGFDTEDDAAKLYDRKSICTFGLKAKTNFDYTKYEILEILKDDESIIL
jgi:hypothetical protein